MIADEAGAQRPPEFPASPWHPRPSRKKGDLSRFGTSDFQQAWLPVRLAAAPEWRARCPGAR